MATLLANAHNVFETIGVIQPRIEPTIGEARNPCTECRPLRMRWMPDTDLEGRRIMRIHWVEDVECGIPSSGPHAGSDRIRAVNCLF
jgi:hypothetical protein